MTEPGPLMKDLGRLEQASRDAIARRDELDAARRDKPQAVERKKAEIAAEDERFGATGERDDELVARLLEEQRELERDMSVRNVTHLMQGGTPDVRSELYDPRAEAAYRGAEEAVKQCELDLRAFASANVARLAVELEPQAQAIKRQADAWLAEGRRIAQEESAISGLFARLLTLADREALLGTFAESAIPPEFVNTAPKEAPLALPECFWPSKAAG